MDRLDFSAVAADVPAWRALLKVGKIWFNGPEGLAEQVEQPRKKYGKRQNGGLKKEILFSVLCDSGGGVGQDLKDFQEETK